MSKTTTTTAAARVLRSAAARSNGNGTRRRDATIVPAAAAATTPFGPALGCLLDSFPAVVGAVLGGVLARLAQKLWSKRHASDVAITFADTPENRAIIDACPHFTSSYDAVDVLRNQHACTIVASLLRENLDVQYQREVLRMRDGGHVTLDWPLSVPSYPDEQLCESSSSSYQDRTEENKEEESTAQTETAESKEATAQADADADVYADAVAAGLEGKAKMDAIVQYLQYGKKQNGDGGGGGGGGEVEDSGVPGVIGEVAGGGADGCGSGGGGCDVSDVVGPPFRRAIPDQGRTVLRRRLARLWRELPDDAPVLILMSGIAGGSHDKYLKHFLRRAHRSGYRVVAFNCRGTSSSPLTTPQFYSASFTGDVRAVVDELRGRWPGAKMFAVGWSLGANILTNFLGEEGSAAKLDAAVAMCNPFDLNMCDDALQEGFFGTVYSRSMAKNMRKLFEPHAHLFNGLPNYDRKLVESAATVRDFDEAVTRVTFGFPSVDDYYDASSSRRKIGDVAVPLLVVQAADDPIAVHDAVPRDEIKNNPNVLLVETESGGHLGWTAGAEAPFGAPWPDVGAMQFIEAVRRSAKWKKNIKNKEMEQKL